MGRQGGGRRQTLSESVSATRHAAAATKEAMGEPVYIASSGVTERVPDTN